MKMNKSVLHPTLYTPATTSPAKVLKLVNGNEIAAWRIVLCTEDSIREGDIPAALLNLKTVLEEMSSESSVATFVRVRNPEILSRMLDLPHVERLRGFVIPKTDPESFPQYADQVVGDTQFRLMPILESPLMTDRHFRETLRTVISAPQYFNAIDCVRIGANDLMGHLGIRRDDSKFTIYDTPVGQTIFAIINEFRGLTGFKITAPVFECFAPGYDPLLLEEVGRHMMNGLYGQTVIHPRHIRLIRDAYKVSPNDLKSARSILGEGLAVNGLNGKMDEATTHRKWAELVLERYELFGDSSESRTHMSALV